MENASKALLIAGAILIAILLIAIGMMVFNSANGVIETSTSNMSQQQKTAFNRQFTVYNGTKSGSVLKELVELLNTNNAETSNVEITYNSASTANILSYTKPIYTMGSAFTTQSQYLIVIKDTNDDGVVDQLTVTQK